jgi:O-antigen/teichoic acid export membrane protein
MMFFAFAATVNIGLNLIFIPRYGLVGAALITVLAEVLTLFMGMFVLYKNGIRLKLFRVIWRPIAAALLMGLVLVALGSGRMLILSLGVGGVCYVLFLAILRGIPQDIHPYLRSTAAFANDLRIKFLKV